ncbi:MAG: D-alanyl-D-alanine carboxypeptidase/D-alanyl-D-alanine-endopeptidase (penicillin-binding protein 4) [Planctomycetota bacterium]|jgi:D-alanyl-D-alanine carboxypeptidase/D-alanyl-D-alanine-endopeptidase (penicillin-binding protein 4)
MDSGERRRQTARTARLSFLAIANLAALIILVRAFTGGDGDEVVAHNTQPAVEVLSAPAIEPEPREPLKEKLRPVVLNLRDSALEGKIEGCIAAAVRDASKRSGGKVNAQNTTIAVHVFDPKGSGALAERQANIALRPASNMKLVTSAAALVVLGAEWNFETRFDSSAQIVSGVLRGDLVVRAGGDPLFDAEGDGRAGHLLAPVIKELRARGIRKISGDIVLDQGLYLEAGPGPGWPSESQHWQEHCALSAGFSANAGCLTAVVASTTNGSQAKAELYPKWHGLERVGSVKTVKASARLNIAVGATAAKATLRGDIPSNVGAWSSRFAHPDPVALFGTVLLGALRDGGIDVLGQVTRMRNAPAGENLATLRTPLWPLLAPINTDSNNSVADQLFLAMGAAAGGEGTRSGGRVVVTSALSELGVSGEGLVQVDGSGLSRDDRVTAKQLSSLLAGVLKLDAKTRDAFISSLAVAGTSGSLESRMKAGPARGRVFAKTGWIEGTGSLSGYAETLSGERLCFSILVDYPKVAGMNKYCWKPMQDRICEELVRWSRSGGKVR